MSVEFFNLELEEKFLLCLLRDKKYVLIVNKYGLLPDNFLSDKSFRAVLKVVMKIFATHGILPTYEVVKNFASKLKSKVKDNSAVREKFLSVVDRLFNREWDESIGDSFNVYFNELKILHRARSIQEHVIKVADLLDNADVEEADKLIKEFKGYATNIDSDEGEYVASFKERERIVIDKMRNPEKFALLPLGIPKLDEAMDGGLSSEFMLISGNSNTGKSFFLEHAALYNYRLGKNMLHFTIEMQKLESMNRIDCALAGIESRFFRNPGKYWERGIHEKWRKKIQYAHKNYGKLGFVAFNKGTIMDNIEAKMYEYQDQWGSLDGCTIDYLDDITPKGIYREAKSWQSLGEIAWDMHTLAKGFRRSNGVLGIPVISAIQMKKTSKEVSQDGKKENRWLDERDIGGSPLPYRIADVVWGIKTVDVDKYSMLEGMKGRFFGKNKRVDIFHNFGFGRFYDDEIRKKYEESLSLEDKEEIKEIEEMEIDVEED